MCTPLAAAWWFLITPNDRSASITPTEPIPASLPPPSIRWGRRAVPGNPPRLLTAFSATAARPRGDSTSGSSHRPESLLVQARQDHRSPKVAEVQQLALSGALFAQGLLTSANEPVLGFDVVPCVAVCVVVVDIRQLRMPSATDGHETPLLRIQRCRCQNHSSSAATF